MKRTINLEKIDYINIGKKTCLVTIEIEIKDTDEGKTLSICGNIWNHQKTNCYSCGQNYDEILKAFPKSKRVKRIVEIWKRWHLNDMRAGCIHQREAKWDNERIDPKELPDNKISNQDKRGILSIWVTEKEHPKGLLCKPCPICNYKYGSAWLYEPLPEDIIKELETI